MENIRFGEYAPKVEAKSLRDESIPERRGRLFAQLAQPLGELTRLEDGRAKPGTMYDALVSRPGDAILFGDADRLRRACNGIIRELNASRPAGTEPIRTFYEHEEAMRAIEHLGTLRVMNARKRQTGVPVPPADEVTRERIAEAVGAYVPPHGDQRAGGVQERISETLEQWAALERAWEILGIGAGAEGVAADAARHRSFENMRERVRSYVNEIVAQRYRDRRDDGTNPDPSYAALAEEAAHRLRVRVEAEAGAPFELVYYEQPEDVPALFRSGAILVLTELPAQEQSERRKSGWKDLSQVLRERAEVEAALGWPVGAPVYHLVAQTDADMRRPGGPAENYGGVGFVIDQTRLPVEPTFTEGDSLNPSALPGFYPHERGGNEVLRRAVTREHLPLANAILDEGRRMRPSRLDNRLRYIEAQVGGVTGAELFAAVKEVVINAAAFDSELSDMIASIETLCAERGIPLRRL